MGKISEFGLHNWGYHIEPEPNMNGRSIEASRGKVLGGSSSTNAMAFTRGNPGDYDRWAQKGAQGWSFAEILPYFKRLEAWQGGESPWRGDSGPIGVERARTKDPLYDAWIDAGKAAGYPFTSDYNGQSQVGFGRSQYSIRNGRRSSSASAYLRPARGRSNLVVMTGAHTGRILLDGKRATGVEFIRKGRTVQVHADREVILSAGAFGTPQLLMLSGIGPAIHLREVGVEPIVDLPVGKNLQDHLGSYMMYERVSPGPFRDAMRFDRMAVSMIRAYLFGTGPATALSGGLHAFIKTRPELAVPDIEFQFRGLPRTLTSGSRASSRPMSTDLASGLRFSTRRVEAKSGCARPIRAIRCGLSETFCLPPAIYRRCVRVSNALAMLLIANRWIRFGEKK